MVLHPAVPLRTEVVNSQAIRFRIDDREQSFAEGYQLCWIEQAFENRVLDTLTIIQTRFGHLAQPAFTAFARGGNVVSDEHLHRMQNDEWLLPKECRIRIQVFTQVPGEQPGLEVRQQPPAHLLLQERMQEFLTFTLLPSGEHFLA